MKPFNRERFLLWLLAGLLGWQATLFTYGTVICASVKAPLNVRQVCPNLAENYSKFVQTTLGAVLGLLAGSATQQRASSSSSSSSSDDRDASASPLPPQPLPRAEQADDPSK